MTIYSVQPRDRIFVKSYGDLIGNIITYNIVKVSRTYSKNILGTVTNKTGNIEHNKEIPNEKDISRVQRQKVTDDLMSEINVIVLWWNTSKW